VAYSPTTVMNICKMVPEIHNFVDVYQQRDFELYNNNIDRSLTRGTCFILLFLHSKNSNNVNCRSSQMLRGIAILK
jgi:hypothetical protein